MRPVPPEGFGGVGDHGDAQLDGIADGEAQVLVTVTKICAEKNKIKYGVSASFPGAMKASSAGA